jgi:putative transposase
MKVADAKTGQEFFSKRRQRFNLPKQARELTFSCYRKYPFLESERTREWFREALEDARKEFAFQVWAYVLMPDHVHLIVYPNKLGGTTLASAPRPSQAPSVPPGCQSEVACPQSNTRVTRPESAKGVEASAPQHVRASETTAQLAKRFARFLQAVKEPVARKAVNYLRENSPQWLDRITVCEGRRTRHRFWQPGGGYDRNVTDSETLRAMIEYIHANPIRRGLAAKAEEWEWSSARWYAGVQPAKIEMDHIVLEELI